MIPWLLIVILILILIFLVISIIMKAKYKRPTDYYSLFWMGIIWIVLGIPLQNFLLSGLGIVFMVAGLVNKKKWKQNKRDWKKLTNEEKKVTLIVLISLGILLLIGAFFFFLA